MLKKPSTVPAFQSRELKKSVAPVIDVLNRGLVLDSQHVIGERQPNGRVRLKLHPTIAAKLGI